MRFHLPLTSLVTSSAIAATNLYVSSYAGTITSLQLTQASDATYTLTSVAVNEGSAPNPSFLTLDTENGVLYCADEGLTVPDGSMTAYSTSPEGALTLIKRNTVISGPVHSVPFNDGKALAVAHYTGSSVTTYEILPDGGLESLQNFTFTMAGPGPNAARQEAPHPHQVIVDPTGAFLAVPDLGADLVRIYSIDKATSQLTEQPPLKTPRGTGPRHGVFLAAGSATYLFLVSELANLVSCYSITYTGSALGFQLEYASTIYGNQTVPEGAAAAEAVLSPDNKFLLTSSRNDSLFQIDNFDPTNPTKLPSDTLQTWAIEPETGRINFKQLAPSGGIFPRQFSVNKNGSLAAVGLQTDGRVVIVERNVDDGTFGKFVASINVPGEVTSVIWDE